MFHITFYLRLCWDWIPWDLAGPLGGCSPRLCRLRTDGLALVSKYWTYRSHPGNMGLLSLVAYHQQRVALLPLLRCLSWERNCVRTRGSVSQCAGDYVRSPFSRGQWLCLPLLMTSRKVSMRWQHERRMVWDHTRTEPGMCVACWSSFLCMVYINLNRRDSQIWVTACLWPSARR
jgi:hypothetical protein